MADNENTFLSIWLFKSRKRSDDAGNVIEEKIGAGIQPRFIANTVPRIAAVASEAGETRKGSVPIDNAYKIMIVSEHVSKGLLDGSFEKRIAYLASVGLLRTVKVKDNVIAYFVDLEVKREGHTLQVPIRVATGIGKRMIAGEVGLLATIATLFRKAFEAFEREASGAATVVKKVVTERESSEEEASEAVKELAQGLEGSFSKEGDENAFEARFKIE